MEIVLNDIDVESFKNLNMRIFSSKITAIIGDNASGKSIISELLGILRKPKKGSFIINKNIIDFRREDINYNQLRFDIGLVSQNCDMCFFQDNVYDHIAYQLNVYNYKATKKRIIDSLKMVGLNSSYLNRKIKTLSDSERFKIVLATTLSINPKVLVLDDPTCFLDEKEKQELFKLIKMMKIKYNKTIVISSNDTDFILRVADYIYVINNNKVLLHGTKYDVFTNRKLNKANINVPDIIKFQMLLKKKAKINLKFRDNINDLIKDIYYYIEKKNSKKRGKK